MSTTISRAAAAELHRVTRDGNGLTKLPGTAITGTIRPHRLALLRAGLLRDAGAADVLTLTGYRAA